jgi:hypothetical protein
VAGQTFSLDFPVANAYLSTNNGPYNLFLTKISTDGSSLMYSTFLGEPNGTDGNQFFNSPRPAIALDASGRAYFAGQINVRDIVTHPFELGCLTCGASSFVAIFDTTRSGQNSLLSTTFLDGAGVTSISVDSGFNVHVAGWALAGFPAFGGFQNSPLANGNSAAFYAKLNPGATQLMYATYLGTGSVAFGPDQVSGLALDASGNAYVTGINRDQTLNTSTDGASIYVTGINSPGTIPVTSGAFSSTLCCGFAAKINPNTTGAASLVYSTYLGVPLSSAVGNLFGVPFTATTSSIVVDSQVDAFVTGQAPAGLPLVNPTGYSSGGVYESSDGGLSWNNLSNGIPSGFWSIALDASTSPSTLFAGSGIGTVYISTDGGLTWSPSIIYPASPSTNSCGHRD